MADQYGDTQVGAGPPGLAMPHRLQADFARHTAKCGVDVGQPRERAHDLLQFQSLRLLRTS